MSLINSQRFSPASFQRGFTLIEILVTVVVLSVGLLGLAGLQAAALKFNSTAYQRSQATVLIYDMIERIRANPDQKSRDDYLDCILGKACVDPTALADIQAWQNAIIATLPGAVIDDPITLSGGVYNIKITWDDSRGQDPLRTVEVKTNL